MARLLIIDDSPFSRKILRAYLEGGGHQVMDANDGLAGLEKYALERPDVVMLDLTMTGMAGLEVLEQLRQMDPQARIMIASADIQSGTRRLASDAGACGYIQKPFVADDVLKRIDAVLEGQSGW